MLCCQASICESNPPQHQENVLGRQHLKLWSFLIHILLYRAQCAVPVKASDTSLWPLNTACFFRAPGLLLLSVLISISLSSSPVPHSPWHASRTTTPIEQPEHQHHFSSRSLFIESNRCLSFGRTADIGRRIKNEQSGFLALLLEHVLSLGKRAMTLGLRFSLTGETSSFQLSTERGDLRFHNCRDLDAPKEDVSTKKIFSFYCHSLHTRSVFLNLWVTAPLDGPNNTFTWVT